VAIPGDLLAVGESTEKIERQSPNIINYRGKTSDMGFHTGGIPVKTFRSCSPGSRDSYQTEEERFSKTSKEDTNL